MNKHSKSNYMILALTCLVVLNIGSILIRKTNIGNKESLDGIENKGKLPSQALIPLLSSSSSIISYYENDNNDSNGSLLSIIQERALSFIGSSFTKETVNTHGEENHEEDDFEIEYLEDSILIDELEEYESLIIVKDSDGINKVENIPEPLMINKVKIDKEKPYVLLYHTHATESYLMSKAENYRNSNKNSNIVGIGEIIGTVLEANGHKVDHDQTYHDMPSYNKSYSRSLSTINKKKEESDNLKFLLDVHRDAIADENVNIERIKSKSTININGKSVATFSLVVGPDSANKDQVLSFAKYIKAVSDALYPGLCTGILIKPTGRYNQYLSDYSTLIEVGYNFHTMEEASEGAKLVGEVLALAMNSIVE